MGEVVRLDDADESLEMGINYLRNCVIWFCFDEGFEVVEDEALYRALARRQSLAVETRAGRQCVVFEPGTNYMGMASGGHLDFTVCVKTPARKGNHPVRVLVSAEPRWGQVPLELTVSIDAEGA